MCSQQMFAPCIRDKGLTFSPNSLIDKYCLFEVMDSGWSEDDPENTRVLGKAVWSKNSEKF